MHVTGSPGTYLSSWTRPCMCTYGSATSLIAWAAGFVVSHSPPTFCPSFRLNCNRKREGFPGQCAFANASVPTNNVPINCSRSLNFKTWLLETSLYHILRQCICISKKGLQTYRKQYWSPLK